MDTKRVNISINFNQTDRKVTEINKKIDLYLKSMDNSKNSDIPNQLVKRKNINIRL
ncbi:MAG: hypothetical protein Q4E75_07190 [bacterium]|nr:hypothetical protein [bacterium]